MAVSLGCGESGHYRYRGGAVLDGCGRAGGVVAMNTTKFIALSARKYCRRALF